MYYLTLSYLILSKFIRTEEIGISELKAELAAIQYKYTYSFRSASCSI